MSTYKRTSIHYQLYMFGNDKHFPENVNICQYVRGVCRGIMTVFFAVGIGVLASLVFIEPVVVGIGYLITGAFVPFFGNDFILFGIGATLEGLAILAIIAAIIRDFYTARQERLHNEVKDIVPSPLTLWYLSFKEKTCFLLDFEGKKSQVFNKEKQ